MDTIAKVVTVVAVSIVTATMIFWVSQVLQNVWEVLNGTAY